MTVLGNDASRWPLSS